MTTPITSVAGVTGTGYLPQTNATTGTAGAGNAFASSLTGAVDQISALQAESSALSIKAVTGTLTDIHDATIASARASVTLQLAAAVRNRGVEAFTEIMRMQA